MSTNIVTSHLGNRSDDIAAYHYETVSPEAAKFLRLQASRIRQYIGKSIVQIGKDLTSAKHYLSHGEFLRWVEYEVGIPARTAQAYMQAAHWAATKRVNVAHLPPSLLYLLSARSTPDEFSDQILRRIEAGERVKPSAVRVQIKSLRDAGKRSRDGSNDFGADHLLTSIDTQILDEEIRDAVFKAVAVLAMRLPGPDFVRLRRIMTDHSVLHKPTVIKYIADALSSISPQDGSPLDLSGEEATSSVDESPTTHSKSFG